MGIDKRYEKTAIRDAQTDGFFSSIAAEVCQ
ncbi:hypothetical protein ES703_26316 [subsurface metagenome]